MDSQFLSQWNPGAVLEDCSEFACPLSGIVLIASTLILWRKVRDRQAEEPEPRGVIRPARDSEENSAAPRPRLLNYISVDHKNQRTYPPPRGAAIFVTLLTIVWLTAAVGYYFFLPAIDDEEAEWRVKQLPEILAAGYPDTVEPVHDSITSSGNADFTISASVQKVSGLPPRIRVDLFNKHISVYDGATANWIPLEEWRKTHAPPSKRGPNRRHSRPCNKTDSKSMADRHLADIL